MEEWLQQLMVWLPDNEIYLLALLFVAFFESLPVIGLIMPGSTLVVLAGFLAAHGQSSLLPLMLCTAFGAFAGDLTSYWLGARVGNRLMLTRMFRKRLKMVHEAETFFASHGGKSLFFARFLGPIRGITPFVAGGSRMRPSSFVRYTLISSILWGISYPGLGFLGGASWENAQELTTRLGLLILLALAATIVHYYFRRKLR